MNMKTLLSQVVAESACAEELLDAMEQEHQAMADGRFDELPGLTARKTQLLERMAELDMLREAAQMAQGFAPGRAGADAAAAAGGEAMVQAWSRLLSLAARARMRNQRSGAMVQGHLDYTQRTLDFLHGSGQPFYGRDGIRRATGRGSSLAYG